METKIKIYSILIGLIYFLIIFASFYTGYHEFKRSFNDGYNGVKSEKFYLHTQPIDYNLNSLETMINTLTGEKVGVEMMTVRVSTIDDNVPKSHVASIFSTIRDLTIILITVVLLYIPILFLLIVKSIWQNNLMNQKLVKRIKRMGWILLSLYFYTFIFFDFGTYYLASQCIALENYKIILDYGNCELIVLGLLTLMLGEILSHALKMKEEQDLTI